MNKPPIKTARFNSRFDLTVMNRTTSCGWDITPIPTPKIRLETNVHQKGLPNEGMAVHPVNPVAVASAVALAGTTFTRLVRAWLASTTPPSIQYIVARRIIIPKNIILPCKASVYITPRIPPNIT